MEDDQISEATAVSEAVINNIVNNIIDANSDNSSENEGVSESLATALESLTEESAKEIFEDKPELSSKTSNIISTFLGNTDTENPDHRASSNPTPLLTLTFADDSEDSQEGNLVIEEPQNASNAVDNLQRLDEITFSEDSVSQPPLDINWETIESRPASVTEDSQKLTEDKSNSASSTSRVMQEVIDEFAEESDASQLSENTGGGRKSGGRRVKSIPKKRRISSGPEKNNDTDEHQQDKEEVEACQVAEDVDQIVDFLRQTAPAIEQEKTSSSPAVGPPDVTNAIDESATHLKDEKQESFTPAAVPKKLPTEEEEGEKTLKVKRKRKMGRKRRGGGPKKKAAKKAPTTTSTTVESPQVVDNNAMELEKADTAPPSTISSQKVFKPIGNWHKIMKISTERPLAKSLVDQIFKNVLEPYVPCVPKNTSQRLIDALTERELEQLMCPGCKDRFLMPNTFLQHMYRKSARISFVCGPCGDVSLSFHNRCHLRTHILSHCEIDGLASVAIKGPETIQVSPLEASDLHVGFLDDSYSEELKSLFSDYKVQEKGAVKCTECEIPVANIFDHFNCGSSGSNEQECSQCKMWLPSKCSLQAHQRIHRRSPDYVCPECCQSFETWGVFKHHVQRTCHHEARVLVVECRLCTRKNNNISVYVDWSGIYGHLYQSHIQLFYKCSSCPKAYAEKMAIYEHRQEVHKKEETRMVADFCLLYKAAFLKAPGSKLFSTREAFEARISPVIKRWKRLFKFKCFACQSYFENPQQLSSHNVRWCQMLHSEQEFSSKIFNAIPTENSNNPSEENQSSQMEEENDLTDKEAFEKMNEHLAHLEALSFNCAECQKIGLDYRAHLVHHRKRNEAALSASTKEKSSLIVVKKAAAAKKNDDSDAGAIGSRITRQRLEAHSSSTTSTPPTRTLAPNSASSKKALTSSATATASSSTSTSTPSSMTSQKSKVKEEEQQQQSGPLKAEMIIQPRLLLPPTLQKVGKKRKTSKKSTVVPNSFVEALGIDVPSERHLLSFNRISKKALAFGATAASRKKATPTASASSTEASIANNKNLRKCALCDFSSELADSFASHIRIHKPIINREVVKEGPAVNFNEATSDCLQCKECGMCFASEPSWRKHLFLLHRIKKPQASDYCDDLVIDKTNQTKLSPPINDEEKKNPDDYSDKYDFDHEEECSLRNNCNVCLRSFNSELELRRHFRSHGVAFITQKPPPLQHQSLKTKKKKKATLKKT